MTKAITTKTATKNQATKSPAKKGALAMQISTPPAPAPAFEPKNAPKLNDTARSVLQALELVHYTDDAGKTVNAFGHNVGSGAAIIDSVIISSMGNCTLEMIQAAMLSNKAWVNKAKGVYPKSHKLSGKVVGTKALHAKMRDHLRYYNTPEFKQRLSRVGVIGEKASAVMQLLGPVGKALSLKVRELPIQYV